MTGFLPLVVDAPSPAPGPSPPCPPFGGILGSALLRGHSPTSAIFCFPLAPGPSFPITAGAAWTSSSRSTKVNGQRLNLQEEYGNKSNSTYLNPTNHCCEIGSQPLRLYACHLLLQHVELIATSDNRVEDLGRLGGLS